MTIPNWTLYLLSAALLTTALLIHRHNPNRRWDAIHYHATTARWGIGPVGDGKWRHTLGISIVLAGHGYALFRWPKDPVRGPVRAKIARVKRRLGGDGRG